MYIIAKAKNIQTIITYEKDRIISAAIDDINVYVGFSRSFGYVNISIYDATDCLIYSNNVNTEYQRLATIPYLGGGHPAYIVLNSANGMAEGNF